MYGQIFQHELHGGTMFLRIKLSSRYISNSSVLKPKLSKIYFESNHVQ